MSTITDIRPITGWVTQPSTAGCPGSAVTLAARTHKCGATFFAWVVAPLETVGAVLLILGLGTRILAIAFAIDMLVAIVRARIPMGASFGPSQGNIGWEFEFILLVAALALLFTGAGSIALDPLLGL